jgi:hypothetical protein
MYIPWSIITKFLHCLIWIFEHGLDRITDLTLFVEGLAFHCSRVIPALGSVPYMMDFWYF